MLPKHYFTFSLFFFIAYFPSAQNIYDLDATKDIAYISTGIGLNILGSILANHADKSSLADINALSASDIWAFDRGATHNYSSTAQTWSDIILISGATLPFITYFSKKCRVEGSKVAVMAVETFLFTNGITNLAKAATKRYRPFNYNPEVDNAVKLGSGSRLSFFSGHASNTAAMSFFAAKVLTDLHPDMKNKFIVWTTAATIPAAISYLRYKAGKHFPTDLIVGYGIGATIGYLVPTLHLKKDIQIGIAGIGGIDIRIPIK